MSVSEAEVVCLVKAYLEEKFPRSFDVFKEESKGHTQHLTVQAPPRALRAIIQDYVDLKTEKVRHETFVSSFASVDTNGAVSSPVCTLMGQLSQALGDYEAHRNMYPNAPHAIGPDRAQSRGNMFASSGNTSNNINNNNNNNSNNNYNKSSSSSSSSSIANGRGRMSSNDNRDNSNMNYSNSDSNSYGDGYMDSGRSDYGSVNTGNYVDTSSGSGSSSHIGGGSYGYGTGNVGVPLRTPQPLLAPQTSGAYRSTDGLGISLDINHRAFSALLNSEYPEKVAAYINTLLPPGPGTGIPQSTIDALSSGTAMGDNEMLLPGLSSAMIDSIAAVCARNNIYSAIENDPSYNSLQGSFQAKLDLPLLMAGVGNKGKQAAIPTPSTAAAPTSRASPRPRKQRPRRREVPSSQKRPRVPLFDEISTSPGGGNTASSSSLNSSQLSSSSSSSSSSSPFSNSSSSSSQVSSNSQISSGPIHSSSVAALPEAGDGDIAMGMGAMPYSNTLDVLLLQNASSIEHLLSKVNYK